MHDGKWSGPVELQFDSWPSTAPSTGQVVDPATHAVSSILQRTQEESTMCITPYVLVQRSASGSAPGYVLADRV